MKSNRYDISLIRKYLDGRLDERSMYELERQAHEDPLLMDLINGMESAPEEQHENNLDEIDELIGNRTGKGKTRRIVAWRPWTIAASVLIALSVASLLILRQQPEKKLLTQQTPENASAPETIKPAMPPEPAEALTVPETRPAPVAPERETKQRLARLADKEVAAEVSARLESRVAGLEADEQKAFSKTNALNEVVIIGYGTSKKADLVGSVASIAAPQAAENNSQRIMIRGTSALAKKGKESDFPLKIAGIVTDENRQPLPGVSIRIKGKNITANTDVSGMFTIDIPSKEETLLITMLGYDAREIRIKDNETLNILLNPSTQVLSELVVAGNSDRETKAAQPAAGWNAYRKYLRENTLLNDGTKGNVVVSFTVSANGEISNIRILKGLNEIADKRAIQLITEGDKWTGDSDGLPKDIKLKIRFR